MGGGGGGGYWSPFSLFNAVFYSRRNDSSQCTFLRTSVGRNFGWFIGNGLVSRGRSDKDRFGICTVSINVLLVVLLDTALPTNDLESSFIYEGDCTVLQNNDGINLPNISFCMFKTSSVAG